MFKAVTHHALWHVDTEALHAGGLYTISGAVDCMITSSAMAAERNAANEERSSQHRAGEPRSMPSTSARVPCRVGRAQVGGAVDVERILPVKV